MCQRQDCQFFFCTFRQPLPPLHAALGEELVVQRRSAHSATIETVAMKTLPLSCKKDVLSLQDGSLQVKSWQRIRFVTGDINLKGFVINRLR